MSDPIKQPSDAGEVDTSKFVPKEEYEKLGQSVKELETKLDEAKLNLLDPDYIDFLESKKGTKVEKKVKEAMSDVDINKLSSKQILEMATEKAKEALMEEVLPKYENALKKQGATIQDILAYIELGEVEKKHKDFDDYREDIKKILETSKTPLSIEQAYKLAKSDKHDKDNPVTEDDKTPEKKPTQSEKPTSTVPGSTLSKTAFKTPEEAADDAWNKTVGAGKDIL